MPRSSQSGTAPSAEKRYSPVQSKMFSSSEIVPVHFLQPQQIDRRTSGGNDIGDIGNFRDLRDLFFCFLYKIHGPCVIPHQCRTYRRSVPSQKYCGMHLSRDTNGSDVLGSSPERSSAMASSTASIQISGSISFHPGFGCEISYSLLLSLLISPLRRSASALQKKSLYQFQYTVPFAILQI